MLTEISTIIGLAVAIVGVTIKLVELDPAKRAELIGWFASASVWAFFAIGLLSGMLGMVEFATSSKPIDRPSVMVLLMHCFNCIMMVWLALDYVRERRRTKLSKRQSSAYPAPDLPP